MLNPIYKYNVGDFPVTDFTRFHWEPFYYPTHTTRLSYTIWPQLDIPVKSDSEGNYTITQLLAGVDKQDVQVTYEEADSQILLNCTNSPEFGDKEKTWTLTKPIDPKSLKAVLANGVLTITCKVKTNSHKVTLE